VSVQPTEPERRILIAHDITVRDPERRWIGPLKAFWPGHSSPPRIERLGLYDFRLRLGSVCEDGRGGGLSGSESRDGGIADAVLLIVGRGFPSTHLFQLVDQLDRSRTPTILVLDDRSDVEIATLGRGLIAGTGLIVENGEVSPGHLASALLTLIERQPAIRKMSEELGIHEAGLKRVHSELERVNGELYAAARLQKAFVRCATPYTPEVDFGIVYRPATYVSGDIFDIERLDDRHIAVLLADAVGHGVQAGLLTLFISRSLPMVDGWGGSMRIVPPAEALKRLNLAYCARGICQSRFATAVYGVLDTQTMRMRLSSAGHPAPLLLRESGAVEHPAAGGPLLGVFPEAEYEDEEIDLSDAHGMVLYTDGFEVAYPPEGRTPGRRVLAEPAHYLSKLRALAEAVGDRNALADAIAAMEAELDAQLGSLHQADDVTAITIAPRREAEVGGVAKRAA